MAAKGSIAKEELMKLILETIPNSFVNDKEIRVNMIENSNPVQIKITFTAAKVHISDSPKNDSISETSAKFEISDEEREGLIHQLEELGVDF